VYEKNVRGLIGLNVGEQIAGIVHIGSSTTPKVDRPRPDIDQLYSIREG
jgi:hypothetical protein